MKNNTKILLIVFAVLSLILLIVAGSYAWFSTAINGTNANSITTNGVTFHYQEGSRTIGLNDAMPMPDSYGKSQSNYFEFEITGQSTDDMILPYYITARKSANSSDIDEVIKVSLSKVQIASSNTYAAPYEKVILESNDPMPEDYYYSEEEAWVRYKLLHSAGDAVVNDAYSIYDDSYFVPFSTEQECEEAISEEESLSGASFVCVQEESKYVVKMISNLFDSLEECNAAIASNNYNTSKEAQCTKKYSAGDTYPKNVYDLTVWGLYNFSSLEECNQNYDGSGSCILQYRPGDVMGEEEVITTTYDKLVQYTNDSIDLSNHTEKLVYANKIPDSNPYSQKYRLRMWIDEKTDFSIIKYNGANFSLSVNVYSNGKIAPDLTVPGLYNDAGDLIASWDTLVNTYGLDASSDYSGLDDDYDYTGDYNRRTYTYNNPHMYGYIIEHNPELSYGTRLVLGNISKVGSMAFAGTNIKELYIPASVEEIKTRAFYDCYSLQNVELAENSGLTTVGYDIFRNTPWGNTHNTINGIQIPVWVD